MSADTHNRDIDRVLRRRSTDQLAPGVGEPYAGIKTRRADLVDVMRRRGDGTLDIVLLTDEEAVTLGLQRATLKMRVINALRYARDVLRGNA